MNEIVLSNNKNLPYLKLYRNSLSDLCWLIKSKPSAMIVFLYILECSDKTTNKANVSRLDIAEKTEMSVKNVSFVFRFLKKYKFIHYKRLQRSIIAVVNSKYVSKGNELEGVGFYDGEIIDPFFAIRFYEKISYKKIKKVIKHKEGRIDKNQKI